MQFRVVLGGIHLAWLLRSALAQPCYWMLNSFLRSMWGSRLLVVACAPRWEGLGQILQRDEAEQRPKMPRGLYMHGGVGTGKTMLMDLMAESAPTHFQVPEPHSRPLSSVLAQFSL